MIHIEPTGRDEFHLLWTALQTAGIPLRHWPQFHPIVRRHGLQPALDVIPQYVAKLQANNLASTSSLSDA